MIEITRGKYIGIGWLPHQGDRFRWQVYVPINTPGHPEGAIVAGGTYGTEIDGDEAEVRARIDSELERFLPHWNPQHWAPGQAVTYGEFPATIVRHYHEGMWEIRLPGGLACVTGADILARLP